MSTSTVSAAAQCPYPVPTDADRANFRASVGQLPHSYTANVPDNRDYLASQSRVRFTDEEPGGITRNASTSDGVPPRSGAASSQSANQAFQQSAPAPPVFPATNPVAFLNIPITKNQWPLTDPNAVSVFPPNVPNPSLIGRMPPPLIPPTNNTFQTTPADPGGNTRLPYNPNAFDPTRYFQAINNWAPIPATNPMYTQAIPTNTLFPLSTGPPPPEIMPQLPLLGTAVNWY